ncbi:Lipase 3 [Leucoagaricus sp. SymC.cos]|nr:Lipase 3 [Leucoagaricus sp. SymC.cos]
MFSSVLLLLAAGLTVREPLFTSAATLEAPQGPIVDLGYAKYLGNRTTTWPNTVSFLGLPYAEPPVGNRRFRAPLPLNLARVTKETGGQVVDARSYPDFCIQGALGPGDHGGAGSEDCLKVNVYTPAGVKPGAKLPVLVYIHGGGYVFGNPANWPFEHWIQQSPNVVIVSVYYRLSGFGFLAAPEFANGQLGDLNAGFLDQMEALRWVQRHIDSFGGDPNKVTINGQSAGGSSIELHLVANGGKEALFSGGIGQSVFRTPVPTPEQQQPLFDAFTEQAGCGPGSLADKMACLRSASISALAIAQDNVTASLRVKSGYHAFHPVMDGRLFSDFPTQLIQRGMFRKVPIIVGATTNETGVNGPSIAAAIKSYFPSITDGDIQTLEEAYPSSSFASDSLRQQTLTGDFSFRCARSIMASAWSTAAVNTWTYRYNQPDPASTSPSVDHAAENAMVFRGTHTGVNGTTVFIDLNASATAFSEELIAYWLSFVRAQNPNTHKLARAPVWQSYSTKERNRIVLNEAPDGADVNTVSGSHGEIEGEDEAKRCQVVAGMVADMED